MSSFSISSIVKPQISSKGPSFRAIRVNAEEFNGLMDPILGFDHFQINSDVFGPHPHAGMSAITYLFENSAPFRNMDSLGTDLVIQPGCLQWTWSGYGVVHNEFPEIDGTTVDGLQLFLNIPADRKQLPPFVCHIKNTEMPNIAKSGVNVKVVSGKTGELENKVKTPEELTFLDIELEAGKSFKHVLPVMWNASVYLINGDMAVQTSKSLLPLVSTNIVSLGSSNADEFLTFIANKKTHFLIISGPALKEAVYKQGSFAMNSQAQIDSTFDAYENGKFGFIRSEAGKRKIIPPVSA